METVEYQPFKRLFSVGLTSVSWGSSVCFDMARNIIKFGPTKFFGGKNRDNRPAVLDDPELGTHHFAEMKNIRLHYVAKGPEDGPLMLFLHGFPEFWYSWRHQLKEFGKDYRAVAVDMRGYSESDKPEGISQYHTQKLTDDIKEFIEHIGYKKCILVAHDWCGSVAWLFAAKYPDMVEKYIVCNMPNPLAFQKHLQSSEKQYKMSWYMFFFQLPWLPEILMSSMDMDFLTMMFKSTMTRYPQNFTEEDLEAFKYTFRNRADITGPLNYYRAAMRYVPDRLPSTKVQCKTLIIWGCKDTALDKATVQPSTKYVNNECIVKYIENANHWVQQQEPQLVNQYMREFLGNISLTSKI